MAVLTPPSVGQVGQVRLPGQVGNSSLNRFGSVGSERLRSGTGNQFGGGFSQMPTGPTGRSSMPGSGLSRPGGSRAGSTLSRSGNALTMSGVELSGPRAELMMARDVNGRSPYEGGYYNIDTSSPVSRLMGSGTSVRRPNVTADRYGMIFARQPLSAAPRALPRPPSQEQTAADRAITAAPTPVVAPTVVNIRERTLQESEHYFARGLLALFSGPATESPRFDSIRQAQFEFDRVRRLLPGDPRAFLWSALAAIRMGNNNEGMELWRQCLVRYERSGTLADLRIDIDKLITDTAEAARIKQAASAFLTGITTDFNLRLDQTPPGLRPRGKALTAVTMWLANERNAFGAAERVQQAQILESDTLAAEDRLPVLGRLYDQFIILRDLQRSQSAP